MNTPLSDYSMIGNCRSAALVSKNGSIDWCCMPEFHSPSIFTALLDDKKGDSFSIQPVGQYNSSQSYVSNTNILETEFENEHGNVLLRDAFVVLEDDDRKASLFPDHEILRIVEGGSGSVRMKIEFSPTINYGKSSAELKDCRKLGIQFFFKEGTYILQSSLDTLTIDKQSNKVAAEFVIDKGDRVMFSLSYSSQSPAIIPEIESSAHERMQKTFQYWRKWIGRCKYDGFHKDLVLRSALTLKLLTHAPSGAIIAAPTTSLPEAVGGTRNWDYRYCWLRDASFTVRALIKIGYYDEARIYLAWILHATQLTRPRVQVVYDVFGHSKLRESTCDWLSGYRNSRPVRIGNAAHDQFQLDVYGEVIDAIYTYAGLVSVFDNDMKNFLIGLGKAICALWNKPDEGIWEIRSSSVHHTHSKVMAWVGLDRLIKLSRQYNWRNAPIAKFEKVLKNIEEQIEQQGFNDSLQSYTRQFNGTDLDASLLILSLVDYCKASSSKMEATVKKIQASLMRKGFLFRYLDLEDGLPGKEGAFVVCNFWLIENLVKLGSLDKAIDVFNTTIESASPCGLLSEEIDPDTGELLGNYPQAFSHIGLINAALAINEALQQEKNSV